MSDYSTHRYRINELAELTEVSRRAIRYYVQRGLMDAPYGKGRGSYYDESHLKQLLDLKSAQERGVSLEEIEEQRKLLSLAQESTGLSPSTLSPSTLSPSSLSPSSLPPSNLEQPAQPLSDSIDDKHQFFAADAYTRSKWQRINLSPELELNLREGLLTPKQQEALCRHIIEFFNQIKEK